MLELEPSRSNPNHNLIPSSNQSTFLLDLYKFRSIKLKISGMNQGKLMQINLLEFYTLVTVRKVHKCVTVSLFQANNMYCTHTSQTLTAL